MNNIDLPKIGLGTMQGNSKKAKEAFIKAIQMGYRFLDTAQVYFNERVVGKAIAESGIPRDELIVASKVFIWNFGYRRVKKSTNKSLKRLGLEKIDIMYIHWPFRTYLKRKDKVLKAFSELVEEGKIGFLGVSNFTSKHIDKALELYDKPIVVNQVEMHPWLQQRKLLEYLNEKNMKLVAYFPLLHGRFNQIPELVQVAKKHKVSAAQVSLAWIISKGAIPIPKSVTEKHLKENLESQNLILDDEDIKLIDSIKQEKRFSDFPVIAPQWDD